MLQRLAGAPRRRARIVGVACGTGARDRGCADGPDELRRLGFLHEPDDLDGRLHWDRTIHVDAAQTDAIRAVVAMARSLACSVGKVLSDGDFPLVIGGDHSCAIGTWAGVRSHLGTSDRLGLIWIDAHMDSHTFKTSPSLAIHGMPLACLLGHGDQRLIQAMACSPAILPEDVCLIGVRSFEWGEAALLRNLGVRVFFMDEVKQRGLRAVFHEALARVRRRTTGYGISLDLDALDPTEEAGVGSPVPDGLHRSELVGALRSVHADRRLLALEIVEYNPYRDRHHETAKAVRDLCASLLA